MKFELVSTGFESGALIPRRYSCNGEDLSPAFEWQGAPQATKSFALICSDPDAPGGTFFHWAVFDMPSDTRRLVEGMALQESLADGVRQALNDFGKSGYAGPCPPKGHGIHHYHFRLYALNVAQLDLPARVRCREVETEARSHGLAVAETVGLFER